MKRQFRFLREHQFVINLSDLGPHLHFDFVLVQAVDVCRQLLYVDFDFWLGGSLLTLNSEGTRFRVLNTCLGRHINFLRLF